MRAAETLSLIQLSSHSTVIFNKSSSTLSLGPHLSNGLGYLASPR